MKRIKKIFASFGGLVLFGISKIWKNTSLAVDPLYAPPSELYEYNIFINTMEKRLSLGKIIIPILFLIIGLIAIVIVIIVVLLVVFRSKGPEIPNVPENPGVEVPDIQESISEKIVVNSRNLNNPSKNRDVRTSIPQVYNLSDSVLAFYI